MISDPPRAALLLAMVAILLLPACSRATSVDQPALLTAGRPPLPTWTAEPTPMPGVLYVNPDQSLGPISPYVYGTNYGPWTGVPFQMQEAVQAAGLKFLRFPGGAWGDENELQEYQIDQFVTLARQLGAEPSISVRLRNGSPEAAAALVRYANVEKGYDIRYWSIGNEPALYASAYDMDYGPERFNQEWRDIAEAMEAVDSDILLIGPELHQYTGDASSEPRDEGGRTMSEWMRAFLQANGDIVDVVSFHRYPFPQSRTGPPPTIDELRANSPEWDAILPNLRDLIRATVGRDLPIAVTEINSNWTHVLGGEGTPDSFYNAIWWADVLGRLIRQDVEIVAHFALAAPRGSGWGMVTRNEIRPLYYVYQLFQRFGTKLVYASSPEPDLSILAARRDDGALTVIVVNRGPQERTVELRLDNFTPSGPAEVWRLDQQHLAERIGSEEITDDAGISIPSQSVSLYVLQ